MATIYKKDKNSNRMQPLGRYFSNKEKNALIRKAANGKLEGDRWFVSENSYYGRESEMLKPFLWKALTYPKEKYGWTEFGIGNQKRQRVYSDKETGKLFSKYVELKEWTFKYPTNIYRVVDLVTSNLGENKTLTSYELKLNDYKEVLGQCLENKNSGFFDFSYIVMPKKRLDYCWDIIKDFCIEKDIGVIGISQRYFLRLNFQRDYSRDIDDRSVDEFYFTDEYKDHLTYYKKQKKRDEITQKNDLEKCHYNYVRFSDSLCKLNYENCYSSSSLKSS